MQSSMGMFTFFFCGRKYPFWENLVQKIKIVSLRLNLISMLIWVCRIQWWCSLFFRFWPEVLFLGKFGPKNQNCQFKMKLDTYTNPNIHNSMVMFTFFCFWPEILFLGKFGPKSQNCQFKVKLLRWNLILALIRICRIQWWCLLFSFSTGNTLFGKSGPKNQDCHLKAKLGT